MKTIHFLLFLLLMLSSFDKTRNDARLVFEEEKSMRSSFCMYSDGRFYETRSWGCTGQGFSSGYWENKNDTIILTYQDEKVFDYEISKSTDTTNKYQIVRIIDCYNQPVRFQTIDIIDSNVTYQNLYNPGMIRMKKGKSILYMPFFHFGRNVNDVEFLSTNADTITYKWHCNRECIESIDGGDLFIDSEVKAQRIVLKTNTITWLTN